MTPAEMVREFHEAFGLVVRDKAQSSISEGESYLRRILLAEESEEVDEALRGEDTVQIASELADLVYVAYGTALHYGVDLDSVIAEVHRANMSKLGADGYPIRRGDGKVLRGPDYRPPDIEGVLGL